MSAAKVYEPRISVVLKKNIGRTTIGEGVPTSDRYQGSDREIDLTPFLGDLGGVSVSKSVRSPEGMWSVTLCDRLWAGSSQAETLYALIEPMDVVEIRMARDVSIYSGQGYPSAMPIMMRGFVTSIGRQMMMHDGRPYRAVVVSGQDYGKILQIMQISYLPNMVTGQLVTSYFQFFAKYGGKPGAFVSAGDFMASVLSNVINAFLAEMQESVEQSGITGATSPVTLMQLDSIVADGVIAPFGSYNSYEGTVAGLMQQYGDVGPWNELFVEDRETGPFIVYRPTPFKRADGTFIQEPYASGGASVVSDLVTDFDIVSYTPSRSDMNVANWYWVDAPSLSLVDGKLYQYELATAANSDGSAGRLSIASYPNSSAKLYGFRVMQATTNQGSRVDGQKEGDLTKSGMDVVSFIARRRETLISNNQDNVVFEDGSLMIKGNEAIRPGHYITLQLGGNDGGGQNTGGITSECYAVGVRHDFQPFRGFTTSIEFERGTNFIERSKRGSQLAPPYLAELHLRGIS